MSRLILCLLTCCLILNCWGARRNSRDVLNPVRVHEIAEMLSPAPLGPGRPISDRKFWSELAQSVDFSSDLKTANELVGQPVPPISDELYLEYFRNGTRKNYETAIFARHGKLAPLVFAECVTNEGTYLPALSELLEIICAEKTWVLPAHDKGRVNFDGTTITIDLFSSNLGWQLAETDYLLGEKLRPELRRRLRREIRRRIIQPFQQMIRHERRQDWWIRGTNNWNAVCLAGVSGTALIQVESPLERAEIIAAAEHYSKNFLSGFTPDGYCSEGLGYWNYGFGNFALMAENIRQATQGGVDLFAMKGAAMPARFGDRISIINGIIPAFADCAIKARPSSVLMWLLNRAYGWKNPGYGAINPIAHLGSVAEGMLLVEASRRKEPEAKAAPNPDKNSERTVFADAGVYILRPGTGSTADFGVAFKAGNNSEHHNHNDIGSYVVARGGDTPILLDPGPETYTRRTFSKERYEGELLNSHGHAVPVVAGQLQQTGAQARGVVLRADFGSTTDTVVIDMTSAYDVKTLKKLHRTFEYGRDGSGIFVVTDEVEFTRPESFETALVSLADFERLSTGPTVLRVEQGGTSASIELSATSPFRLSQTKIGEKGGNRANRMGVKLREKTTSATVRAVIR